jgi:flagellar L-ring protein precursor FlgH
MKHLIWLALAVVLCMPVTLKAGSIYEKAKHRAKALHTDDTARAVGDTITIAILEKSAITNETKRDTDKKADRTGSMSGSATLYNRDKNKSVLYALPDATVTTSGETKFTGDAKFDSNRSVTDQITVVVQDVLANGNLVVMGTRERNMHGDLEIIEVSGIVRPSDISYTNVVLSEKIADFHVVFKHKGQENQVTNPGWLSRMLNFVSPY